MAVRRDRPVFSSIRMFANRLGAFHCAWLSHARLGNKALFKVKRRGTGIIFLAQHRDGIRSLLCGHLRGY